MSSSLPRGGWARSIEDTISSAFGISNAVERVPDSNIHISHGKPDNYVQSSKKTYDFREDFVPLEHQHTDSDFIAIPDQHSGLVPPPFKYLGPGNSLDRGQPYNLVDQDAYEHDLQYSKNTNSNNIQNADKDFIKKTSDHIVEGLQGKGSISDFIGGVAGHIGIGVKHNLEKHIGQLYPNSFSGKYVL